MRFEKSSLIAMLALALLIASLNAHSATRVEQESEQAAKAYQAKNFQEAASHFQRVVQLDPSNAKAWLFLGQSLAQTNDNMGARKAFAKVLALQSSGQVADRAREQFGKLPDPDLFALQLDSGLTLGDWMPLAEKQITQGKRENVLQEIGQHLKQFGPVPQLLVMQEKLMKETQAEREQQLQQAIAAIKVTDAESAKIALPQIRQLKQQVPNHLKLLQMEAKACHLMQDFSCAEKAYGEWLKTAKGDDPKRKQMVATLMKAKQHEVLADSGTIKMIAILGKHYEIGVYEVTQKQWEEVMGDNPSRFQQCGGDCPVEQVSWNDIQDFLKNLNATTGEQYRLPTEEEWEFACYGGAKTEYCGGDDINAVAWYDQNSGSTTHPVGQKQANGYGLYDMSGNVWEWMQDEGNGGRVLRGGSCFINAQVARAANRNSGGPAWRSYNIGFRLARTLP